MAPAAKSDGTYLVIDNYDSFTYNLVHCLGATGVPMDVIRNDAITVDEIAERRASGELAGIVISPGPCTPNEAGICLALIEQLGTSTPMFGVCLGRQSMGQAYGGNVIQAAELMHGKVSSVTPSVEAPIFAGINGPFDATRYHSLAVETKNLPGDLVITARTDDGEIMGLSHRAHPVHGVQFHPESIASQHGERVLANFVAIATRFNEQT